jgi:hypothetical protein
VHLRRALLLFAIVLGLAALATSVSRPRETRAPAGPSTSDSPVSPPPLAAAEPVRLTFDTSRPRRRLRLESGRAAVVLVKADEPGLAELAELGLSAAADPLTPARFEVLAAQPVRARVRFTPAGAGSSEPAGTLLVTSPGPARSDEPRATTTARDR